MLSTTSPAAPATIEPRPAAVERRIARRVPGHGEVWLVNHFGRRCLRSPCQNSSSTGMRLRVPQGYGVAPGQRYELTGQIPGEDYAPGLAPHGSHWGTIVWSRRCLEHGARYLEVGVAFE